MIKRFLLRVFVGFGILAIIAVFCGVDPTKPYSEYSQEDMVSFMSFIVILASLGFWSWVDTLFGDKQ